MVLDGADHILRGTELIEGMNKSGDGIRNELRDGTREREGQSYARVQEVWRRCQGCRVGSTECSVQIMEDGSIGVRTWLQLMCCTLAEEQGCP